MLNQEGFDLWSKDYDSAVAQSSQNNSYPFAGYSEVLNTIYRSIRRAEKGNVLDIGFGTAALTSQLYKDGYRITGIDFSKEMIETAQSKMPEAELIQYDFSKGLPASLKNRSFDFIVGTYSFHHIPTEIRPDFFGKLSRHLNPGGRILVGDILFPSAKEYAACKAKFKDIWDPDEIYFTADEFCPLLLKQGLDCRCQQISFCSGVLSISPLPAPSGTA